MKTVSACCMLLAAITLANAEARTAVDAPATTRGSIAIANLDHLIAQSPDDGGRDELLLMRARFLADYAALAQAGEIADAPVATAAGFVRRARVRSALHRFPEALADLAAAEAAGANRDTVLLQRAMILVAQGHAPEVIGELEAQARRSPGYATASALASAYASAERYAEADRQFAIAAAALDTTSPFPHAWLYFARGTMWAEQAGDPGRGERFLRRSLAYLPEFVAANLHLAEIEAARGADAAALARLRRIRACDEPEVTALEGRLLLARGDAAAGRAAIDAARRGFDALLVSGPLAFADHAAEFYLGPGNDPARALELARRNLAARATPRARALLRRAEAAVTSRSGE